MDMDLNSGANALCAGLVLVPVADVPKLVAEEKIGHSLVVVALYHFDLWQRGIKKLEG